MIDEVNNFSTFVREFGLGATLAICVVLLTLLLARHILKHQDALMRQMTMILDTAKQERASWQESLAHWQGVVIDFGKVLENHNISAREFHTQVSEAHKYQREEHKVNEEKNNHMCLMLTSAIDEFKRDHRAREEEHKNIVTTLGKISDNLDEQKTILVRVNGFKKGRKS